MRGRTSRILVTAVAGASLLAGTLALGTSTAGADPAPNLGLTGTIPTKVLVGQPFTSHYTITNNGDAASQATSWAEAIDGPGTGLNYVSGTVGCAQEELDTPHVTQTLVRCQVPAIQPGKSYQFQVTLAFTQAMTFDLVGVTFGPDGETPVNLFGGEVTATNAADATGLTRIISDLGVILHALFTGGLDLGGIFV